VGVNFKGASTYQTKMGAFCTLTTLVLTMINTFTLLQAFLDNSKQEEKYSLMRMDPLLKGPYKLSELHLEIAIVSFLGMPEEFGYWRAIH